MRALLERYGRHTRKTLSDASADSWHLSCTSKRPSEAAPPRIRTLPLLKEPRECAAARARCRPGRAGMRMSAEARWRATSWPLCEQLGRSATVATIAHAVERVAHTLPAAGTCDPRAPQSFGSGRSACRVAERGVVGTDRAKREQLGGRRAGRRCAHQERSKGGQPRGATLDAMSPRPGVLRQAARMSIDKLVSGR